MIPNSIFILILVLMPLACVACFLAGAWISHCAGKGISPLPPLPAMIKVNGNKVPPPVKAAEPRKVVL